MDPIEPSADSRLTTTPPATSAELSPQLAAPSAAEAPAPVPCEGRWFAPLCLRDYRLFLGCTVFLAAGQWVQQTTLGWLVYDMTGSSLLLGLVEGVRVLPYLVLTPLGGLAADRLDRRRLLLGTQLVLLVAAVLMGILVLGGRAQVWHVFAFSLVSGAVWGFNKPVRQALVPGVVPRQALAGAVALTSTAYVLTGILVPLFSAFLLVQDGGGSNFLVQGATCAGVVLLVSLMRVRPSSVTVRASSVLSDLAGGVRYVSSQPVVLGVILVALIAEFLAVPYLTLLPVFQKDVYKVGPEGLGMLVSASSVGAALATVAAASLANKLHRRGLLLVGSLSLLGVLLIVFALVDSLPLALVAIAGVEAFHMLFTVLATTILQMLVPDELRGRVLSLYMVGHVLNPVGAMLAGAGTSYVGAPLTLAVMGGLIVALAGLVWWAVPAIRDPRI